VAGSKDAKYLTLDRYGYKWHGRRYQRVSTIKAKKGTGSALADWAARTVAESAQRLALQFQAGEIGQDELLAGIMSNRLAKAHNEARDAAADFGTVFHRLAENLAKGDGDALHVAEAELVRSATAAHYRAVHGSDAPDDTALRLYAQTRPAGLKESITAMHERLWPDVEAFLGWCEDVRPKWKLVEFHVLHKKLQYMGTADAAVDIGGRRVLLDLKTSKGVYTDYSLQLAAYRYATHVADADTGEEKPMFPVDVCAVLHVRDGACTMYDALAGPEAFEAFRACHGLYWFDRNAPKGFQEYDLAPILVEAGL